MNRLGRWWASTWQHFDVCEYRIGSSATSNHFNAAGCEGSRREVPFPPSPTISTFHFPTYYSHSSRDCGPYSIHGLLYSLANNVDAAALVAEYGLQVWVRALVMVVVSGLSSEVEVLLARDAWNSSRRYS